MTSREDHEIYQLADVLRASLDADASAIGPDLLGDSQPDAHRVDREQFLAYIRHGWFQGFPSKAPDQFRAELRTRVGLKTFNATAREAWKGHEQEYQQGYAQEQMRLEQLKMQQQMQAQMMAQQPPMPPPMPPPQMGGMPQMPPQGVM